MSHLDRSDTRPDWGHTGFNMDICAAGCRALNWIENSKGRCSNSWCVAQKLRTIHSQAERHIILQFLYQHRYLQCWLVDDDRNHKTVMQAYYFVLNTLCDVFLQNNTISLIWTVRLLLHILQKQLVKDFCNV